MKIIILAYRDWALKVAERLKIYLHKKNILIIKNSNQFYKLTKLSNKKSLILAIGWSNILSKKIVNKFECYGVHPSDLPNYRGGSPIQNQILNNIINTKVSIYKLTSKIDDGDVYLKKKLSLKGDSMSVIFNNLETSSFELIKNFLKKYPKIKPLKKKIKGSYFKRRCPYQSKISINDFKNKGLKFIYNKIRCLTFPYPNAYIQDKSGNRLYFEKVRFKKID